MKRVLLFLALMLASSLSFASFINNPPAQTGLAPGQTYWLYQSGIKNAYYTFDGSQLCLFVNSVSSECWPNVLSYLLLEDASYFLYEDSGKLILE